jgi:type I restriction enzyme S subunit
MQLLQHFKDLTAHPNNASALKSLILQLAVQGKLTKKWREQNPDVESASALLDKINREKERLVNAKVYKAKYDTEKYEPLIKRPEIPDNWRYVTVGNICELMTGATPSKSKSEYFGGDIKWLVSGDIHKGYIHDCEGRITDLGMESSNCKVLPIDSIMIALNGQGKTRATVALLKTEATCNQSLVAMKPFLDSSELSEYIYYLLKGKYYQIRDITGQKQRRGLNMTLVSQLPIALPPLEEQKAIVDIVNQLFREVEALEEQTKARVQLKEDFVTSALQELSTGDTTKEWSFLAEHFTQFFTEKSSVKKLRESILQLAVQGKLTRDWRVRHPEALEGKNSAEALLERIKVEKAELLKAKKIKKEKALPEITKGEIPYELPESWEWVHFGELATFINGDRGKNYPNKSEYAEDGIAWINTGHINPDGTLSPTRMNYITDEKFNSLRSGKIEDGDLVYCLRGATFGKTAFVTPFSKGAVASSLMIVRSYLSETAPFIYRFLISLEGKRQLLRFDNGSAQPNLSANKVKLYAFPLPPLEEQKAIVEKVNALMGLCDSLEQQIEHSSTQVEQLMQSCLKEVFESN